MERREKKESQGTRHLIVEENMHHKEGLARTRSDSLYLYPSPAVGGAFLPRFLLQISRPERKEGGREEGRKESEGGRRGRKEGRKGGVCTWRGKKEGVSRWKERKEGRKGWRSL